MLAINEQGLDERQKMNTYRGISVSSSRSPFCAGFLGFLFSPLTPVPRKQRSPPAFGSLLALTLHCVLTISCLVSESWRFKSGQEGRVMPMFSEETDTPTITEVIVFPPRVSPLSLLQFGLLFILCIYVFFSISPDMHTGQINGIIKECKHLHCF